MSQLAVHYGVDRNSVSSLPLLTANVKLTPYRKSHALHRMVTLPMTLTDPNPTQITPLSALCVAFYTVNHKNCTIYFWL